jgi:cytochrome c oxidase cbb3-type subunit 3/ubiquinol-cytochrome c reductase cytochrome c subunit
VTHPAASRARRRRRSAPRSLGSIGTLLGLALAWVAACDDEGDPEPLAEGRIQYDAYCALCHGSQGEGYRSDMANALANQDFLATATDELLRTGTVRGRPGTPMSPYGAERGGPLSDAQVDAVVAYIRSWQSRPSIDVHDDEVDGEVERGLPLYEFHCARCHGDSGEGKRYVSVNNPEFLAVASDGFLRYATAKGRDGTEMPGFERELTAQGIDDLVALMRSWAKKPDDTPYEPPSKDLGEVFVNPGGAEPPFDPAGRFIGVDDVHQAIQDGRELALLDARPPSSYVISHISGAVSVPSYEGTDFLPQLPPDHWYITYCGCPHSISGQLYDLLVGAGYPKVKVLDEGFFVWEDRGYPTTEGPEPY